MDIRFYDVIYKLVEDMQKALTGMLEPKYEEVIDGHAEVRQVFKVGRATPSRADGHRWQGTTELPACGSFERWGALRRQAGEPAALQGRRQRRWPPATSAVSTWMASTTTRSGTSWSSTGWKRLVGRVSDER